MRSHARAGMPSFSDQMGCAHNYPDPEEAGAEVMWYPDVKNSKEEEAHWIGLSDFERERFERHANFLIDQGYMAVDPYTLAVKVAWKLRNSPQSEGLVYADGSRARRAVD
jgi:hypothetical protein